MKISFALSALAALAVLASAKEPAKKKTNRTVPGPYPAIIQMTPVDEATAPTGLIQSELGGREMQFLHAASQVGNELLALAELAKSKGGSEQVKAVAETIATTQVMESKEIARLAAAKHVTVGAFSTKATTAAMEPLSGGKFEKAWVDRLVAVNEAGVAAYEVGAKSADGDIRSFAEKMLPVAKARLQMANRLGGRSVAAKPETPAASEPPATAAPAPKDPAAPQAIPPPVAPSAKP